MESADIWMREMITPHDVYLHGADRVLLHATTPYQTICISESSVYGRKLFLDGIVQSSEGDEFVYHEALVQPAALAVGAPRDVLVMGGGEGATIREVLRWDTVEHVTMVDIDAEVIAACRELLPNHQGSFDDPRVELIIGDAVEFLATTERRFDVVISDMTDPVADGPATFCFTTEYFAAIAAVLADEGVLALQAGPMGPAEIDLHGKVVRSIQAVFPEVVSYPCMAAVYGRPLAFAVASRTPITPRLDPARTAPLLDAHVRGPLRYLDAEVARGLMATPRYVIDAIAAGDDVYRDAAPPMTAGAAGWQSTPTAGEQHP